MVNAKPGAGWYDDPSMVNTRRYWDGQAWTEHRQEKPLGPPSGPVPSGATTAGSSGGGIPKWAIRGFGVIIVVLMLWLFVGNGWTVITGGYAIDQAELEDDVTTYLEEDDEGTYEVTCDEPGRVEPGDRSFCEGTASDGREYQVEVTYQSNGGYIMQATLTGGG